MSLKRIWSKTKTLIKSVSILMMLLILLGSSLKSSDEPFEQGNSFYKKGLYDLAIEKYKEALKENPNNVYALNNLGLALREKGLYEEAIEQFLKAILITKKDIVAFENNLDLTRNDIKRKNQYIATSKYEFFIDAMQKWKPPVMFPHKDHFELFYIDCSECHHKMYSDNETLVSCFECHNQKSPNPAKFNEKGTKNIFHTQCTGCHKKMNKGPTKCKYCHK